MAAQITAVVQSLAISAEQTATVTAALQGDPNITTFLRGHPYDASMLTRTVCQTLQSILGETKVNLMPTDLPEVSNNWSQTCWELPYCLILAENAEDVGVIMKMIKFFQIRFSIRSGGHSPNPGSSSIGASGILIDLQKLDQINVSEDKKLVAIGPGQRWGEVYKTLDSYGLGVIGGRIPEVGVGGLILGGGLFHFSSKYGLAADNVKNFEVVLADGSIVNANAETNNDLFWALKGGGSNFGIVTKYDMYTSSVYDIWHTVSIYSTDAAETIIDAFAEWQKTGASDFNSTVAMIIGLDSVTLGFLYAEATVPSGVFAAFEHLPDPLMVAVPPSVGTVNSFTQIIAALSSTDPMRHDYRGTSSEVDAQLYKDVYSVWKEKATALHASTGARMTFVLQPITAGMTAASNAAGGNPMGIPEKTHQWWTTLVDWTDAAHDSVVRAVPIAVTEAWEQQSKERNLYIPYIFANDAARDQNPIASYGSANVEKLKDIADKYDSEGVFQTLQNGGFLLKDV